jgi:hypothetical protein
MKQNSKLYKLIGLLVVMALLFAALPIEQVQAASEVIYNAIPATLDPSYVSTAFQATQTSEFGDYVKLAGTNRALKTVSVTMVTWAYQTNYPSVGDATGWNHPITLNIYNVMPGATNTLGTVIGTITQNIHIPWRPAPDATNCHDTRWHDALTNRCSNGFAFNITFDLSSLNITLPDAIVLGVAFNTETYGTLPIGSGGPYNELNISDTGIQTVGTDGDTDRVFWKTVTAAWYHDGGTAGVGVFREDTGWTTDGGTTPFQITADPITTTTLTVDPNNMQGWAFYDDDMPGGVYGFVAGPGTAPLGAGSVMLATPLGTSRQAIVTTAFAGVRLADINKLAYSTYVEAAPDPAISLALSFDIDYDSTDTNTGWQGRLTYEPYVTPGQTVIRNTWQTWDTQAGNWWGSKANGLSLCPQGLPCSWAQVKSNWPNATLRGNLLIKAGGPAEGMIAYADKFEISYGSNAFIYDFEPVATTLSMTPATAAVANCFGTTTVAVNVGAVDQLAGYDIRVNYDTTKVQITDVVNGSLLTGDGLEVKDLTTVPGQFQLAKTQFGTGGVWNLITNATGGSLIVITLKPLTAEPVVLTLDASSTLTRTDNAWLYPYTISQATSTVSTTTGNVLNTGTSVQYCSLQTAVTAAVSGQNLQALASFDVPAQVIINKVLSFDTNVKTITRIAAASAYDSLFKLVPGGDLTITGVGTLNSTDSGGTKGAAIDITGGKVTLVDATLTGAYASMRVLGNIDPATWATPIPALFTMTSGNVTDSIVVYGHGAELSITGGVVTTQADGFAPITGNGTNYRGGTKITVGGTAQVISPANYSAAIYHPQDGILIVNGGSITGGNGIEMKAGNLTVTGGTISGTGTFVATLPPTGTGSTDSGDAILVYSMPGYTGPLSVNISGGIITSANGYALREYTPVTDPITPTRTSSIVVTGGIFTAGTASGQAPESVFFTTVAPSVLKLTGGAYQTDPGNTPDYVFEPFATYVGGDSYYQIEEMKGITGEVTMQGRVTRAGVPLLLANTLHSYPVTSSEAAGNNYSFGLVAGGTYVFTTNQDRYLNVTATVIAPRGTALNSLRLRGGNVTDVVSGSDSSLNKVDLADAGVVAGLYGHTGNTAGDANFDGIVNIQDLAMVGGNFYLTSAVAYGTWQP